MWIGYNLTKLDQVVQVFGLHFFEANWKK